MGLSGNLTTAEILEQLVHADSILASEYSSLQEQEDPNDRTTRKTKKLDTIRNVVFMGMYV